MASPLPGYSFDQISGRYRSTATGRFVARDRILGVLDDVATGAERRLARLATASVEGRVSPSVFSETLRTEMRRLHHQQAALGAGGWDRLTPSDFGRIGGKLRADYARSVQFAEQIARGELSTAQAIQRTNMYAGNARVQFWEAERAHARAERGMIMLERRMLGVAEHCPDCVEYYQQGWTRVGTLPVPGTNSQCLTNCKCSLRRRSVPESEMDEWLGTKR